jgi:hypothetical protein
MTKDEAIKIVRKTFPDLKSARITETANFFIFSKSGPELIQPIMVRKSNGECRGYVPPLDGE